MYVILVYDVNEERVSKINRYLKRFLLWRQNSVFEGEISEALIESMVRGIKKIIKDDDSMVIYKFKVKSYIEDLVIGSDKGNTGNII
jgi:CRISPR-associated protein Cas2